jgi:predicted nucleotidyltransferase
VFLWPADADADVRSAVRRRRAASPGPRSRPKESDPLPATKTLPSFLPWRSLEGSFDDSLGHDLVAWRGACRRLVESSRLLDSQGGLDTLTLNKELLRNLSALESVLVDATLGRFLTSQPPRDAVTGMPLAMPLIARRRGWCDLSKFTAPILPRDSDASLRWYTRFPVHTLGTVVAHRLELALWHGFWEWQSSLRKGVRPPLPRIPEAPVLVHIPPDGDSSGDEVGGSGPPRAAALPSRFGCADASLDDSSWVTDQGVMRDARDAIAVVRLGSSPTVASKRDKERERRRRRRRTASLRHALSNTAHSLSDAASEDLETNIPRAKSVHAGDESTTTLSSEVSTTPLSEPTSILPRTALLAPARVRLRNREHLALFWDRASLSDRRKILGLDATTSIRRDVEPGPPFEISVSSASTPTRRPSLRRMSDAGSDFGDCLPPSLLAHSVSSGTRRIVPDCSLDHSVSFGTVPVGMVVSDPRSWTGDPTYIPATRFDDALDLAGSRIGGFSSGMVSSDWPSCALDWAGSEVVQSLFQLPLEQLGTRQEVMSRHIGRRLIAAWSQAATAMDLHLAHPVTPQSKPPARAMRRLSVQSLPARPSDDQTTIPDHAAQQASGGPSTASGSAPQATTASQGEPTTTNNPARGTTGGGATANGGPHRRDDDDDEDRRPRRPPTDIPSSERPPSSESSTDEKRPPLTPPTSREAGTSVTPLDFVDRASLAIGRVLRPTPSPPPPDSGKRLEFAGPVSLTTFVENLATDAMAVSPVGVGVDDDDQDEDEDDGAGWREAWLGDELLAHKQWCLEHARWRRPAELAAIWRVSVLAQRCCASANQHKRRKGKKPKPAAGGVKVFGSIITGLALPTSDVDILIENSSPRDFHLTATSLRQQPWVASSKEILTTAVPVIKVSTLQTVLVDESAPPLGPTSSRPPPIPSDKSALASLIPASDKPHKSDGEWMVSLDVTMHTPHHRGILTTNFVQKELEHKWALGPLVLFLKQALRAADLHDSASGGLSSYAAFLIVRAFLQLRPTHSFPPRPVVVSAAPTFSSAPVYVPADMAAAPPAFVPAASDVIPVVIAPHSISTNTHMGVAVPFLLPRTASLPTVPRHTAPSFRGLGVALDDGSTPSQVVQRATVSTSITQAVTTQRAHRSTLTDSTPRVSHSDDEDEDEDEDGGAALQADGTRSGVEHTRHLMKMSLSPLDMEASEVASGGPLGIALVAASSDDGAISRRSRASTNTRSQSLSEAFPPLNKAQHSPSRPPRTSTDPPKTNTPWSVGSSPEHQAVTPPTDEPTAASNGHSSEDPHSLPASSDDHPSRARRTRRSMRRRHTVGAQTSLPASDVGHMAIALLRFIAEDMDPQRVAIVDTDTLAFHTRIFPPALAFVGPHTPAGVGPLIPRGCGVFPSTVIEDPLIVLDPLDTSLQSNVARSCFRFHQVRAWCGRLLSEFTSLTRPKVHALALLAEAAVTTSIPRDRGGPPSRIDAMVAHFPVIASALRLTDSIAHSSTEGDE